MNHARLAAGTVIALATCNALAQTYTFESTGVITDFGSEFSGADMFPFVGLSAGDSLFYHFEYDISTAPTSSTGLSTIWEISGTNSYAMLGSTRVDFDRIQIVISSDGVSSGSLGFSGFVDAIGVSAGLGMDGSTPLAHELPTSININDFTWARNAGANSDQNPLLFPIVMGTVDTVTIVPAPGAMGMVIGGVYLFARRRR